MIGKNVIFYEDEDYRIKLNGIVIDSLIYKKKVINELPSGKGGSISCINYIPTTHYLVLVSDADKKYKRIICPSLISEIY